MVYDPYEAKAEKQRRILAVVTWIVALSSLLTGFPFPPLLGLFLIVLASCFSAHDFAELGANAVWPTIRKLFLGEGSLTTPDYSEARTAMLEEDWPKAVRVLRDYIDADPEDQQAVLDLALLYDKQIKNLDLAVYWYGKVLAFDRKNGTERLAFTELIDMHIRQSNLDEATKVCSEMVERFPMEEATKAAREKLRVLENRKGFSRRKESRSGS